MGMKFNFLWVNTLDSSYKINSLSVWVIMWATKKKDWYSVFEKKNSNEYFFFKIHTLYILHTLSMIYTLEMIKLAIDKRSNNALLLYKQGKQTANPNNLNKNILGKIKIFKVFSFFLHGITNLYRSLFEYVVKQKE